MCFFTIKLRMSGAYHVCMQRLKCWYVDQENFASSCWHAHWQNSCFDFTLKYRFFFRAALTWSLISSAFHSLLFAYHCEATGRQTSFPFLLFLKLRAMCNLQHLWTPYGPIFSWLLPDAQECGRCAGIVKLKPPKASCSVASPTLPHAPLAHAPMGHEHNEDDFRYSISGWHWSSFYRDALGF